MDVQLCRLPIPRTLQDLEVRGERRGVTLRDTFGMIVLILRSSETSGVCRWFESDSSRTRSSAVEWPNRSHVRVDQAALRATPSPRDRCDAECVECPDSSRGRWPRAT